MTRDWERCSGSLRVEDRSALHGVYQRALWDRLVPRIPARITPNALTLVGHLLGVVAVALCIFAVEGRRWCYVASALVMFVSLTLDQLDGAHARRTGQCSRRGELLDHGLDGIRSTAVLMMAALLLRMGPWAMTIFAALGTLTFAVAFWEQYRTGHLSSPTVGPIEGVTALLIWQLMVAVLGEPEWLRFSDEQVTAGTVIVGVVVVALAVAVLPPMLRARKWGARLAELVPLFAVVLLELVFVAGGAAPLVVVTTMGLVCAHATSHFIVLRHERAEGPALPRTLYLVALPVGASFFAPLPAAVASLVLAIVGYGHTVRRGWRLLA
ncbi:MAG: CDP-alcohol phosphatidyltransferase family protein [Myxococcales bacterium]|nr:CDP-alcohol phosphatidyltransferase family protein [Myxococcales bacterium]